MSLDQLRDDLKRNAAEAGKLDEATSLYMSATLWPFLEAFLDEVTEAVSEIDDAVAELVDQQEDYLQPETAGVFAALAQSSMQLAAELKKRSGGDARLLKLVSNHEQIYETAVALLGDITMITAEEADTEADGSEAGGTADA